MAFYADGVFGYLLFGIMLGPSLLASALQFPRPKGVILMDLRGMALIGRVLRFRLPQ